MSDGAVEFEIKADNSQVGQKINDTTNMLKSAAGQWESSTTGAANSANMFSGVLQGVGQTLGNVVIGAAKNASTAILNFGKECINAASDLAETENVVNTVFGDQASKIYDWSKSAQSSFGLTQTQALRYSSTLGAMMKSSGVAQNEITEMSTALAGLAADMASFYNMDFDTAFDKIRSGISGETEPLKALGINLSVANLEAYALANGIETAYSKMSQAEQVALRYNYIMQATADAQGDFARTSDGYANSIRRIETGFETLKTNIGKELLPIAEAATNSIAELLESINDVSGKPIEEQFKDIDVDFEDQLAEIMSVHEQARILIDTLEELHEAANVSDTATPITQLISALSTGIPGLYESIQGKDPTSQIAALAGVLASDSGISLTAWTTALESYDSFAEELNNAMNSANPTSAIHDLAEELSSTTDISTADWETILSTFSGALITAKDSAENTKSSVSDLITALSSSIPGLYDAIKDKDPTKQINDLASALSDKTGVSMDAWTTALESYESFATQLSAAMESNNPAEEIEKLAAQLSAGSGISVKDWGTILNTFAESINTAGIKDKADETESAIQKLSDTLGKKTDIDSSAWKTAFDNFNSYRDEFFTALSANDPAAKLDELAQRLAASGNYSLDVSQWKTVFTTLQKNLDAGASELSTEEIIAKLNDVTGAIKSVESVSLKDALEQFKTDAGTVDSTSIAAWNLVLSTFANNIAGFKKGLEDYPEGADTKIKKLADALSGITGDEAKVNAWQELIGLLSEDISGLADAMDWDDTKVSTWLNSFIQGINTINPSRVDIFDKFLTHLTSNGDLGNLETAGSGMQSAADGISAVGDALNDTYYASEAELEVLSRLVDIFPQLSAVVNTTTGEIKGGLEALREYVNESEAAQIKLAVKARQDAKQQVIAKKEEEYWETVVDAYINQKYAEREQQRANDLRRMLERQGIEFYEGSSGHEEPFIPWGTDSTIKQMATEYNIAANNAQMYSDAVSMLQEKAAEQKQEIQDSTEALKEENETLNNVADSTEDAADSTGKFSISEEKATEVIKNYKEALKNVVDYQNEARKDALAGVDSVVHGLEQIDLKSEDYKKEIAANTLQSNLDSQITYLEQYSKLMDEAKEKGASSELLASFADGSMESLQYLRGIANAIPEDVEKINQKFALINNKKLGLANKIAEERLAVDTEFQAMIQIAQEAAAQMDQSATAGAGASATMEAIVGAVSSGRETLAAEVAAVNALLAELGNVASAAGFASGGGMGIIGSTGAGSGVGHAGGGGGSGAGVAVNGSYALGLDYVPFDGFIAELHRGETILTPDEAALWRNFTGAEAAGDQQAFDYDMLTASISSGMPSTGGNVYLNGETVGRVISQAMGNSYRRLERSGWRG